MSAKQYRKKPVVIEAMQYDGTNASAVIAWSGAWQIQYTDALAITTLEGDMRVSVGDYVIRGVAGEFYPCKPDIFEATYEAVD